MYSKEIMDVIALNHAYEYVIVDKKYTVVQCSEGLMGDYSYDASLSKTLDIFELVPELVGMEEELEALFDGQSTEFLIPLVFKEPDTYVNIRIHKSPASLLLIVLFENITEITKAQQYATQVHNENLLLLQEIEEKNRQLKSFNEEMHRLVEEEVDKNRQKQHMLELQTRHAQMGEMIAIITHQWKQPLSVIQTVGTLIKMKHEMGALDTKMLMQKIDNILVQANYLNQTVHDFQKFFTPSKQRDTFNVKQTIMSVLDLVRMDYSLNNIDITIDAKEDVYAEGYANEYNQVVLSLLQNAKEAFGGKVNRNKHIHISICKKEGRSHVCIEDNAGGIPKEKITEIFKQYMTTKAGGSGLGLYIAKSVIENNMGGKLWVENSQEGARFIIVL